MTRLVIEFVTIGESCLNIFVISPRTKNQTANQLDQQIK